jgi:hypothetical protein
VSQDTTYRERKPDWKTAGGVAGIAGTVAAWRCPEAGLGKSTVAYWEAGQRLPSLPELNALLDALQVTAAQRSEVLSLLISAGKEAWRNRLCAERRQ